MIPQSKDKEEMSGWLDRPFHRDKEPKDNLFRGVTTASPLSYAAIKDDPDYWARWIDGCIKKDRCTDDGP
jgi:hypothetical protein